MSKKSPHPTDKYVGLRVKMQRQLQNMNQGELGYAIGISFRQVQKYEKGTNRIGASRLLQIAHVLGVPVEFFFKGAPGAVPAVGDAVTSSPGYIDAFTASADGIALMKAFTRIPQPKLRRRIVDLVEQITDAETGAPVRGAADDHRQNAMAGVVGGPGV
jgi:transcriptional regulator with XRE-family HTH domain